MKNCFQPNSPLDHSRIPSLVMSIYNYFKQQRGKPRIDSQLRAQANLSQQETRFIHDALANATPARNQQSKRHGVRYEFDERLKIANYARFNSPHKASQKYQVHHKTARKYMGLLNDFLKKNKHVNVRDVKPRDIPKLVPNKGGRPAYLSKKLKAKAKATISGMRGSGIPVNNHIIAATLDGILRAENPRLLARNGGIINPNIYARSFRRTEIGTWSFRVSTSKRRPDKVKQFEINKWRMSVNWIRNRYKIPYKLIANLDESFSKFVNVGQRTFNLAGAQYVRVIGLDDKRGLSQTHCITASGHYLPLQFVYGGMYNLYRISAKK